MSSESLELKIVKVKDDYKVQKLSGEYLDFTDARFYRDGFDLSILYDSQELSEEEAGEKAVGYLKWVIRRRKNLSFVSKVGAITQFLMVPITYLSQIALGEIGDKEVLLYSGNDQNWSLFYGGAGAYLLFLSKMLKNEARMAGEVLDKIKTGEAMLRPSESLGLSESLEKLIQNVQPA